MFHLSVRTRPTERAEENREKINKYKPLYREEDIPKGLEALVFLQSEIYSKDDSTRIEIGASEPATFMDRQHKVIQFVLVR